VKKQPNHIARELRAIKALFAEGLNRASRLEEELAPIQGLAPRKGKKPDVAQLAVDRRNKRMMKRIPL
jgi:hypothetical protein